MRPGPRRPTGLLALLVAGLLLTVPSVTETTGATFSDTAPVTTGEVGTGAFVPPAANAVSCATSSGGTTITFTTPRVQEATRTTVDYVLRLYRTNVSPAVLVGGPYVMEKDATSARLAFTTGGLTLLLNASYEARVTTRLTESTRESSPERISAFREGGLLFRSFACSA